MDYAKEIIKTLEAANPGRRMMLDVFADFCRAFALAIESPFTTGAVHEDIEREYAGIIARNGKDCQDAFAHCAYCTTESLEEKRVEFLGTIHEKIGAANKANGQFFTPPDVANVCARICTEGVDYKPGNPVRIYDPACGACVMLIAEAESMRNRNIAQRDIVVVGGDIDIRALDMGYIELSLLGYAACMKHENALTCEVLSRPRLTPGYFLHGFPMREMWLGKQFV